MIKKKSDQIKLALLLVGLVALVFLPLALALVL